MGDCPRAVRACRFRRLPPHRTERRRRHLGRQGQRRDARPNARAPRRRGRRRQVAARTARAAMSRRGLRLLRACAAYLPAPSQSFSQARTVQLCYLPGRRRRARSFTTTTTITTHTTATTTSSLVFERAPPFSIWSALWSCMNACNAYFPAQAQSCTGTSF